MSKTLKIFLIVAGAAIGVAILLISTDVGKGLIENTIEWLNIEITKQIPSLPKDPIPTPSW